MSCRVLIHALFNCLADWYDSEALDALARFVKVKAAIRGGDKVVRLKSISRIIEECRQTDRFWELFSAVFPLRLQRWEDLRLALGSEQRAILTVTPDLVEPVSDQTPSAAKLHVFRNAEEWPAEDEFNDILDDCIMHAIVLGNPRSIVNIERGAGPQWVRTAYCRYRDLPVVFWVRKGEKKIWQERMSAYGIVVPDSAQEYRGRPFDLGAAPVVNEIDSKFRKIQMRLMQPSVQGKVFILHISDIHLGANCDTAGGAALDAERHYNSLVRDLGEELRIHRLDYIVVSGDIANCAKTEEYVAARMLLKKLTTEFKTEADHVIVVPGNHDVDYEVSRFAAEPDKRRPSRKEADRSPEGLPGLTFREGSRRYRFKESTYRKRFKNFSTYLYKPLFGKPYPEDYARQSLVHPFEEDNLLFVGLNSAWEVDHYNEERATIHSSAATLELPKEEYLRILVAHHPLDATDQDGLFDYLVSRGFSIFLYGHTHEAGRGLYEYDRDRITLKVRAGTFGAKASARPAGIPLQYNLIVLDKDTGTALVETRRREKAFSPWSADARWGSDKNAPVPRYVVKLNWRRKERQAGDNRE